jgi:hypothetical protein
MRWPVCQVAGNGLDGPHQGEGGHVVGNNGFAAELPDGIQNRAAHRLSIRRSIGLQALFDTFQAEFQVFGFVILALALNHSARNQQKN